MLGSSGEMQIVEALKANADTVSAAHNHRHLPSYRQVLSKLGGVELVQYSEQLKLPYEVSLLIINHLKV